MTDPLAEAEVALEALGGHNHPPRERNRFNPCMACAYMAAARKYALEAAQAAYAIGHPGLRLADSGTLEWIDLRERLGGER